jgi:drug/metabolite transporter (DMT)-like permease
MRETMKYSSSTDTNRWVGLLLIVISAAAFGTLPIFTRLAYAAGADPTTVLLLRFAIAAGVMVLVMVTRRIPFPSGRVLLALVLMGGLGYVVQSLAYFTALTMISAGLVALLLYLYPAIVTVLSAILFKERLTPVKIGALLLALVGTALTVQPGGGGRMLGIILGIAAAIIYSIYILVGSRLMPRTGAIASSTTVMLAAAIVYLGIVGVHGPTFPRTIPGWIAILAIALVSTVLPIVTFFAGLSRIGPTRASTISTFEPVVTVILAALILGETINALQLLGGFLILAAAVICSVT